VVTMHRSGKSLQFYFSAFAIISLLLIGSLAASSILVGYKDFQYPKNTGGNSQPTGEKPESKLWFNDGVWWGILWSPSGKANRIHRLDRVAQSWVDTGTVVDTRLNSRADVAWDGTHLYVASHVFLADAGGVSTAVDSERGKLYRFSYVAVSQSYTLDPGFPVNVNAAITETLVLAKDSTGRLWVTFIESNQVKANYSDDDGLHWATPFPLPGANASTLSKDDVATIIAYGNGYVGILWSHQTYNNLSQPTSDPNAHSGGQDCSSSSKARPTKCDPRTVDDTEHLASITMNFAVHVDGADPLAWTGDSIYTASGDDHMNLKEYGGYIYAVYKEDDTAKQIGLLACQIGFSACQNKTDWKHYPVYKTFDNDGNSPQAGALADSYGNPTRPILLIDAKNGDLYVFVSLERQEDPLDPDVRSSIYYKKTKLDAITFDPQAVGVPFIKSENRTEKTGDLVINNPTSTKQNLNSFVAGTLDSGLVVLASDKDARFYYHNDRALPLP
jgi:hypothetical protein